MEAKIDNVICPQCLSILRPPFEVCSEVHLLCKNCNQHIYAVDGQAVKSTGCDTKVFSLSLLDTLLRNMSDDCQYGCSYHADIVILAGHENSCPLKSNCAISGCTWTGGFPKLVKHVEDIHPGKVIDFCSVENSIIIGFEDPVLLLTQLNKSNPDNNIYWIRLYKNAHSKYVMIQYQGHTGQKMKKNIVMEEYSVSPVNYAKLSITTEVILSKLGEDDILNDKFVENKGTDITIFGSDKYIIKMKNLPPVNMATLAENLECFICAEIMSGPIRLCLTGHSICGNCCNKINNKCPQCQKDISPLGRNYTLEALAENLLLNKTSTSKRNKTAAVICCKYRASGCPFISTGEVNAHMKVCEYQPKECVYRYLHGVCNWKGSHSEMLRHINKSHPIRYCVARYALHDIKSMFFFYKTDCFVCIINPYNVGEFSVSVYHVTTKSNSEYNFEIEWYHLSSLSGTYTGHCKPYKNETSNWQEHHTRDRNIWRNRIFVKIFKDSFNISSNLPSQVIVHANL